MIKYQLTITGSKSYIKQVSNILLDSDYSFSLVNGKDISVSAASTDELRELHSLLGIAP